MHTGGHGGSDSSEDEEEGEDQLPSTARTQPVSTTATSRSSNESACLVAAMAGLNSTTLVALVLGMEGRKEEGESSGRCKRTELGSDESVEISWWPTSASVFYRAKIIQ
ncbi:hypothetical protein ZWY2020_005717 [Hordeum vulgare]|nr:hypothetical protein ZWY2020_005717 [Hordeum vulgare]